MLPLGPERQGRLSGVMWRGAAQTLSRASQVAGAAVAVALPGRRLPWHCRGGGCRGTARVAVATGCSAGLVPLGAGAAEGMEVDKRQEERVAAHLGGQAHGPGGGGSR